MILGIYSSKPLSSPPSWREQRQQTWTYIDSTLLRWIAQTRGAWYLCQRLVKATFCEGDRKAKTIFWLKESNSMNIWDSSPKSVICKQWINILPGWNEKMMVVGPCSLCCLNPPFTVTMPFNPDLVLIVLRDHSWLVQVTICTVRSKTQVSLCKARLLLSVSLAPIYIFLKPQSRWTIFFNCIRYKMLQSTSEDSWCYPIFSLIWKKKWGYI